MSTILFLILAVIGVLSVAFVAVIITILVRAVRTNRGKNSSETGAGAFSENIKAIRCRLNFSQEYVAEKVGVSRQAVSKWETGSSEPSTANLRALAELYQVSVDELLGPR